MSLRTGGVVATTETAIINPNNLKIEGFYCFDQFSKQRLILLAQDIRDIIGQGLVVNDHDVLTEPDELIRLKQILDLQFELLGKPVQTVSKQKIGKVEDFAADSETLHIQKLYIGQSLLKNFSNGQLSVDRDQIVEITNKRVVIQDLENKANSGVRATAPAI
jgi:sporulation protein YlmC with PRC-barrel domain